MEGNFMVQFLQDTLQSLFLLFRRKRNPVLITFGFLAFEVLGEQLKIFMEHRLWLLVKRNDSRGKILLRGKIYTTESLHLLIKYLLRYEKFFRFLVLKRCAEGFIIFLSPFVEFLNPFRSQEGAFGDHIGVIRQKMKKRDFNSGHRKIHIRYQLEFVDLFL